MKLTAIILLSACLTASASGYSQTVTLSEKDVPLEKVFKEIKKQTNYSFFFNEALMQQARKVTIEVKNVSLQAVLDLCFKDQPLTYTIIGNTVVVKQKATSPNVEATEPPTPVNIKGRVVNEKGEPVEGVTVTIKGTKTATSTDANGEFSFTGIDKNAILVFTSTNMETFEIKVDGKTELSISLKTKVTALGTIEVKAVNTGYQTFNKERFIGSVTTIDSTLFNRSVTTDILSRLDGIANSVLFDKRTSEPRIQIRGLSTLGFSGTPFQPLIIVDNFPYEGELININPNDVENISILKDAVAASVWGARAGNGVIVITTKKGNYNQPFRLSVSSSVRIQEKPNLFYYPQMNTSDFIDVEQFLFDKGFYDANLSNTISWPVISPVVEILEQLRAGKITAATATSQIDALRSLDVRNDYKKYVFRNGVSQQYHMNLSGGTNLLKYAVSIGADNNASPNKGGGGYERYSINTATSFKPSRALELTLNAGYTQGTNTGATDVTYPLIPSGGKSRMYPYAQLADALGNPLPLIRNNRMGYIDTVGGGRLLDWHYRPLEEMYISGNKIQLQGLRLNVGINVRITSWLNGSILYQRLQEGQNGRGLQSEQSYFTRDLINQFSQLNGSSVIRPVPSGGIMNLNNAERNSDNGRAQLNFNKNWKGLHQVTAMVAGDFSENRSNSSTNRLYGYYQKTGSYSTTIDYASSFPILGGGAARIPSGMTYTEGNINRGVGLIMNTAYSFLDRYHFYASARKEGANIYGVEANKKWQPLWSAGLAWDISKENIYKIKWLPSLKLRGSYGYTGNSNNSLTAISFLSIHGNSPWTQLPMSMPSLPNPSLRWEKVRTINVAVDFQVKDFLSGTVEWYRKKSTDVIAQAPIDPTAGFNFATYNVASLSGRGIDISLNSKNLKGLVQWNSVFNFSHTKTIVSKYFQNFFVTDLSPGINPHEGKIAYALYSYKWMGLDPQTGDPLGFYNKSISKDYDAIIVDSFKNQVFNGSSVPLYFGNLINTFSYKGFAVSFNVTYKFDYYFRKNSINYNTLFSSWDGHVDYANRWQKPGDERRTSVPSMIYPANGSRDAFYTGAEINVERGDNIRLENIQFSFPTWENKKFSNFPIRSLQFSFIPANLNLFLWKASKSKFDPDYTGFSFLLPPPKVWAFSLKANL